MNNKGGRIIIGIILFLVFIQVNALQICDGGDFSDICNGGELHNSISGIESFTGNYMDVPLGFLGYNYQEKINKNLNFSIPVGTWGTNYQEKTSSKLEYNIPLGYWGNQYLEKTQSKSLNYVPVGYFGYYKGKNIVFPKQGNKKSGAGVNRTVCDIPQRVIKVESEFIQTKNAGKIKLSWDPVDRSTQLKLKIISPKRETFVIDSSNNSYEYILAEEKAEFKGFIISYNDCSAGLYSDLITIKPSITDTVGLSNKQIIDRFYNRELDDNELFSKLFYLYPYIKWEEVSTYGEFALLIINTQGDVILKDKTHAFSILKDMGILDEGIDIDEILQEEDYNKHVSQISSIVNFRDGILKKIDISFQISTQTAKEDLLFIRNLNKTLELLKKNKIQEYHAIVNCFNLKSCSNQKLYLNTFNKIKSQSDIKIDSGIEFLDFTYRHYFSSIFGVFLGDNISGEEKNALVEILTESMLSGEEEKDKTVGYMSYNRMQLLLIESHIEGNLKVIAKYSQEIIDLYDKLSDKSKLLDILRQYSMK